MTKAIDASAKDTYYLVRLTWSTAVGVGTYQNYTDWGSDINHSDGLFYSSEPSMKVALPANDGVLKAGSCKITLPLNETPDPDDLRQRVLETKHQPVTVDVIEVVRGEDGTPEARVGTMFKGRLHKAKKNVAGESGQIRMEFLSPKAQLDIRSGLPCNHQCINTLYDANCGVDAASYRDFGTVDAIDGNVVTISGLSAQTGRYFDRGWIKFERLSIPVMDWIDSAPTRFVLVRRPPAIWLGKTVECQAGCDKSLDTCKARFAPPGGVPSGTTGNESQFNGIGLAVPSYNPVIESQQ